MTGAGGKPGNHPAEVNLVNVEQCLEVDSLAVEESKENREEVEKEAAQRYLAALFFDRISHAK